jgi:hypothetical protein
VATYSGTYNAQAPQSIQVIEEAYERVGIIAQNLDVTKIKSAQRALDFRLQHLMNRGLNLWTVQQSMMALVPGQIAYTLPIPTVDVLEVYNRTSTRNLGGVPFSSAGGVAASAFDGNPNTACTQTAPNGYISYNWGQGSYAISMVGVQSNASAVYTLSFEYSNDNVNWTSVLSLSPQQFFQSQLVWFIVPAPTMGTIFRVIETNGATLNIQELYFNTQINDTLITRASRMEYESYPIKLSPGRPSSYYVDRQINPIINVWPAPTSQFNNLFFTRMVPIYDVGALTNTISVPARFLESITADLAHILEMKKEQPDLGRMDRLKDYAKETFTAAAEEDRERVPLRIVGDYSQGWASV